MGGGAPMLGRMMASATVACLHEARNLAKCGDLQWLTIRLGAHLWNGPSRAKQVAGLIGQSVGALRLGRAWALCDWEKNMGTFSMWHWLILIAVVAVLFGGKGQISGLMGDVAHGIRNFKEGLKDPNSEPTAD